MKKKSLTLSKVYQLLEPGPVVLVSTADKEKANIMTMSWHMMVDFVPPIIALVMSEDNYSFQALKKTKECVINIPSVELAKIIVGVGNCSGANVDKFKKFKLTAIESARVEVPMIGECYANLESRVIDTKMAAKYNIFIVQVIKAWIATDTKRHRMIHHCGNGVFVVDGEIIKLPSKKK